MTIRIVELDATRESAWTAYTLAHPDATLFHTLEWRALLRQTFKHETHYFLALSEDRVVGILPLVAIKSIFFGRSVVSVPFGVYGGIVADHAEAAEALVDTARELATDFGANYVELRHLIAPPGVELPGTDLYATFVRDLPATPEACLEMIPRKARAEVRKAKDKGELRTTVGKLDLDEFYDLFAENKRKLGSPVFPKSLFLNLSQILGDRLSVMTVRHGDRAVASVVSFIFRDTFMAYYSGATDDANKYSANNLMYELAMEDAVQRGLKRFDFGRSRRETGAFTFKKNQGFEPQALNYQFVLKTGAPLPSINASNPRFDLAKKVFRKLPRGIAERLGSFVVKRMPV